MSVLSMMQLLTPPWLLEVSTLVHSTAPVLGFRATTAGICLLEELCHSQMPT